MRVHTDKLFNTLSSQLFLKKGICMSCPIDHHKVSKDGQSSASGLGACPSQRGQDTVRINPLTQMPFQGDLKEGRDNTELSQDRVTSTIPRTTAIPDEAYDRHSGAASGDSQGGSGRNFWMYPSAQMFYSALKRKGYETDPRDVDAMVAVHNSLNEQVWEEILHWEQDK
jgi:hypothetical protein